VRWKGAAEAMMIPGDLVGGAPLSGLVLISGERGELGGPSVPSHIDQPAYETIADFHSFLFYLAALFFLFSFVSLCHDFSL
jgi:hypothetical protein